VLLGWLFDVTIVGHLHPELVRMRANAAAAFVLVGAAIWFVNRADVLPWRSRAARALAGVVILIGLVTLLEYLFGLKTGVDDLLVRRHLAYRGTTVSNRMSPATAADLILIGLALVVLDFRAAGSEQRPAEWLALAGGCIPLLALLGHLYGVRALYAVPDLNLMATLTASSLFASCGAILLARPDRGLARIFTSATPGGLLARRLLPAALVVPALTGWLRLIGERLGLYDHELGFALLALSNVLAFAGLTAWSVRALIGADSAGRRKEQELRERREHLEITIRSIGDGLISTDAVGRIAEMNAAAEQMTGWPSNDAAGLLLSDVFRIVNEDTREPAENPALRVLEEGVAGGLASHTALIARNGQERSIADSSAPIRDTHGSLRGAVIVFRDVTAERKEEVTRRKTEALFSRLSSAGIIGIQVTDLDGVVSEANDTVLRTVGYTRQELLSGQVRWSELTPPEWRAADQAAARELSSSGVSLPRAKEYFRKDGSRAPVLVGVAKLDEVNCIAFVLDLTESKRVEEESAGLVVEAMRQRAGRQQAEQSLRNSEEQLRQSQKMEAVGRLAGGIAHDFNNLLSVIIGYGQLLIRDLKPEDPMRIELDEIVRAGDRAAGLIRQLLAFSRQQVLQPKVLDLNDTIGGMSKMLARMIGEDVELTFRPSVALGRVFVDPGQIEQIIMNLALNARDAMPLGGQLTIEVGNVRLDDDYASEHSGVRPGPHVILSVTDTGTGIEESIRDRIFEPFFTTKEKGRGTGLGLATVFGIVKQSGGTIAVHSESGKGTTFTIYLPRTDQPVESLGDSGRIVTRERVSETILLVEDEEQVRGLTRSILRRAGYQVLESATGGDALLTCEQHLGNIDLLLTDVVMPKMGGRQLAERLAGIRPGMKILFMSGYTDDTIIHHGVLDAGVAFLQKPIMPEALLWKVREVLDGTAGAVRLSAETDPG
jgi:two-component system, cell cycle sensor histidine kinase and response regulator CckA